MREYIEGTTVSPRFDLRVGATHHEINTILSLIVRYNISNFVEIGVHEGGLTEIIWETGINYLGVEINSGIINDNIKKCAEGKSWLEFIYADCMSREVIDEVRVFVGRHGGNSLVYCDNGNKKREIRYYSRIMTPGNILLTHDFWDGKRVVHDVKDYCLPEVYNSDISFIDREPSFVRIPEELLKQTRLVGWEKIGNL